jgi:hypothetical protein
MVAADRKLNTKSWCVSIIAVIISASTHPEAGSRSITPLAVRMLPRAATRQRADSGGMCHTAPVSIDTLPDALVLKVLQSLPDVTVSRRKNSTSLSGKMAAPLVCRRWRTITGSKDGLATIWTQVTIHRPVPNSRRLARLNFAGLLNWLRPRAHAIQTLDMAQNLPWTDELCRSSYPGPVLAILGPSLRHIGTVSAEPQQYIRYASQVSASCLLNITACASGTTALSVQLTNENRDCTRENAHRVWEAALRSIGQLRDLRCLTLAVEWYDNDDDEEEGDDDQWPQPNWIDSLETLRQLETFQLSDRRLDILPQSLQFDYLTLLEVQECTELTSLDCIGGMPALTRLVISEAAALKALPQLSDIDLPNLATMDIVCCASLGSLAGLESWGAQSLTQLYIESAPLLGNVPADLLPQLGSLPSLTTLLLIDCGLQKFPTALGELTSLTELNLSQNATLLSARKSNGCRDVDWSALVNLKCITMNQCGIIELCWMSWLGKIPSLQLIELGEEECTKMTIHQEPLFLLTLPLLAATEDDDYSTPWGHGGGRGLCIRYQQEWSAQSMNNIIAITQRLAEQGRHDVIQIF